MTMKKLRGRGGKMVLKGMKRRSRCSAAWSPDGEWVAACENGGGVGFWRAWQPDIVHWLDRTPAGQAFRVAWWGDRLVIGGAQAHAVAEIGTWAVSKVPDAPGAFNARPRVAGSRLFSTAGSGEAWSLQVRDLPDGRLIDAFACRANYVGFDVSADGRRVVHIDPDGALCARDLDAGDEVRRLDVAHVTGSLRCSRDASRVAYVAQTRADAQHIVMHDLVGDAVRWTCPVMEGYARSLCFSPDARWLAHSDFARPGIKVRDVATGDVVFEGDHARSGTAVGVDFSPDGTTLASSGSDKSVRLWSL